MQQITYDVVDKFGRVIDTDTLNNCYDKYPTLACVDIGQCTARGGRLATALGTSVPFFAPISDNRVRNS